MIPTTRGTKCLKTPMFDASSSPSAIMDHDNPLSIKRLLENAVCYCSELSGADATPPPHVALQGIATPPSRLFPHFRGCRRGVATTPPPCKGPVAPPHPGPPCRVSQVVWTSKALSRFMGCRCYPRYTLTLRQRDGEAGIQKSGRPKSGSGQQHF